MSGRQSCETLQNPVRAPKYVYSNRGSTPWTQGFDRYLSEDQKRVRGLYLWTIETVIRTTPGNVLVVMPSYSEARWVGVELQTFVDRTILTDQSSSNEATERLKDDFYAGGPKVMVTGARGTITEGVDYDGDKLDAAVVCGVPLPNTSSDYMTAVQTAHDEVLGSGYTNAFTIPSVRKVRQSIGRVIRGQGDVGTRVLVDERYASRTGWRCVGEYIPKEEYDEFIHVDDADELARRLGQFWETKRPGNGIEKVAPTRCSTEWCS